ncbi:MAG: hypothetical protein D6677_07615 [Calditrichaeota bacterium]|nr:MAG: hypothetical protein D6677_07615 [Calditrichota bacterium]
MSQLAFQLGLGLLFYLYPPYTELSSLQYLHLSTYAFLFIISIRTLHLAIADKTLTVLLALVFGVTTFTTIISLISPVLFGNTIIYNIYLIYFAMTSIFYSLVIYFLFFKSLNPNARDQHNLLYSMLLLGVVFAIAYFQVDFFSDLSRLDLVKVNAILQNVVVSAYYIQILNLVFFIFVWYNFFQGQFILSDFLTAILALYFLTILNEVYQLYYSAELMETYQNGLIFNIIINFGMIAMWVLRMHYLTGPDIGQNEFYVLNYKVLGKLLDQPGDNIIQKMFMKLGKQKRIIGWVLLFAVASIPLLFFGSFSRFSRMNILILLGFMALVLILGIFYTQKRWYKAIGHLLRRDKE